MLHEPNQYGEDEETGEDVSCYTYQRCYKDVTKMLQRCYKDFTKML